ncbi:MAG: hypothetical protein ACJ8E8_02465, partial [Sphingomicrobium sp.]
AASTAFRSSDSTSGSRWLAPLVVGIVAIGLIIVAIFLFSSSGDSGENPRDNPEQTTTTTTKKSVPSIKVGDNPGSGSTKTSG